MNKKKILIIDDDPDIVKVLTERLRLNGYEAVGAYDGSEGLKKAHDEEPDAILLDIILPEIHGFEVCKKLKDDPATSKIPIILITGAGLEDVAKDESEIQAEAYIAKPFDSKKLLAVVQAAIEKYSKK